MIVEISAFQKSGWVCEKYFKFNPNLYNAKCFYNVLGSSIYLYNKLIKFIWFYNIAQMNDINSSKLSSEIKLSIVFGYNEIKCVASLSNQTQNTYSQNWVECIF